MSSITLLLDAIISRLKRLPFDLEFAITYKCNLKCAQCNIWRHGGGSLPELSPEEIYKIFSSYRGFKVIGITGGEPFLREDLPQIIDAIVQTQKRLKTLFITTNGQFPELIRSTVEAILWKYKEVKVVTLVSVDGPKGLHDKIRGVPGAYEKALTTIGSLADLRRSFNNFSLGTVTVCSPFNIHSFNEVIEEIRNLKNKFALEPSFCVWFQGQLYKNLSPPYEGINEFRRALIKFIPSIKSTIASRGAISKGREIFYDLLRLWLEDPTRQVVPCGAAKIRFFLDPYGDVYPCTIFNFRMGNLRDHDFNFNEILKSNARSRARELINRGKCPICCNTCETIPSMMAHPLRTLRYLIKSKWKGNEALCNFPLPTR